MIDLPIVNIKSIVGWAIYDKIRKYLRITGYEDLKETE